MLDIYKYILQKYAHKLYYSAFARFRFHLQKFICDYIAQM